MVYNSSIPSGILRTKEVRSRSSWSHPVNAIHYFRAMQKFQIRNFLPVTCASKFYYSSDSERVTERVTERDFQAREFAGSHRGLISQKKGRTWIIAAIADPLSFFAVLPYIVFLYRGLSCTPPPCGVLIRRTQSRPKISENQMINCNQFLI